MIPTIPITCDGHVISCRQPRYQYLTMIQELC